MSIVAIAFQRGFVGVAPVMAWAAVSAHAVAKEVACADPFAPIVVATASGLAICGGFVSSSTSRGVTIAFPTGFCWAVEATSARDVAIWRSRFLLDYVASRGFGGDATHGRGVLRTSQSRLSIIAVVAFAYPTGFGRARRHM